MDDTRVIDKTHNMPAAELGERERNILDGVMERHKHLKPRTDELLEQIGRVPTEISEADAPKVADFIKSLTAHMKALNGARTAEKEDFLAGGRIVDGIFGKWTEPLKAGKEAIEARLGKVLRAKEDRLRREAEEKARIEREAAEARRRAAEEAAERERQAAAEARRQAEEAERRQREAAEQRRREAEEIERRQAEAAEQRKREAEEAERKRLVAAERAQREIEEAQARRRAAEEAAAEAGRKRDAEVRRAKEAEAKAKRDAEEAERQAEANRIEEERQVRKAAVEAEKNRLERERLARQAGRDAEKDRQEAERLARAAEKTANRADRHVDEAERREQAAVAKETKVENAKPADFARTRGDYGGLATLQRKWTFANIDRDKIDLEKLRQHIPQDGLERAVSSFVASGGRVLDGCSIYEDDKTRVA